METYKNSYKKNEDILLWELHEIRQELHHARKGKSISEINAEAHKKFSEWKKEKHKGMIVIKRS